MRAPLSLMRMPRLAALARHVIRHNRVDFAESQRYRERSFWAAFLPRLMAAAEYGYGPDVLSLHNITFASLPFAFFNRAVDRRLNWMVLASWDLQRLIFSKERLSHWGRIERNQSAIRQDLLDRVQRLYLEYHRVARTLCFAPPADELARQHLELRLQEIAAYLDAISGGYWSRHTGSATGSPTDDEGGS
jgi:hypothetical protein